MNAQKPAEPILEAAVIPTTPVDQLSAIIPIGAMTHLVFTMRQPSVMPGGGIERVVQARLVVPTDQLQMIGQAILGGRLDPTTGVDGSGEPVVH